MAKKKKSYRLFVVHEPVNFVFIFIRKGGKGIDVEKWKIMPRQSHAFASHLYGFD